MHICITSSGKNLDSLIDPRFGRCFYFLFLDTASPDNFKAVINRGMEAIRGAGVQSAQTVIDEGVEAVITGNIGPNSLMILQQSGISVFQASPSMTCRQALEYFNNNQLKEITTPGLAGFGFSSGGRGFGRRRFGGGFRRRSGWD